MHPGIIFTVAAVVTKAVTLLIDYLTEEQIRDKQERIRDVKRRQNELKNEIACLRRNVALEKSNREYIRRGALIKYYQARIELNDVCLDILEEAKSNIFNKLKISKDKVLNHPSREYIERQHWNAFFTHLDSLHQKIADAKSITQELHEKNRHYREHLKALTDNKSHKKLGAKKKIQELLFESEQKLLNEYRFKPGSFQLLAVGEMELLIDKLCVSCGVGISDEMMYCYSCACHSGNESPLHFRKVDEYSESCDFCHASMSDQFQFCYNCGERYDPYGLVDALHI